jgi:hypothetical protein
LFPFGEDVVSPGESPIKVESKIFDVVLAGKLQIVQVDGRDKPSSFSSYLLNVLLQLENKKWDSKPKKKFVAVQSLRSHLVLEPLPSNGCCVIGYFLTVA